MKYTLRRIASKIASKAQSLYLTHLLPITLKNGHTYHQIWALFCALSILVGCSTVKYVPIEAKTETITHYVDSVRWQTRDSVVMVEKSIYKDYTGLLDTLTIESGIAIAKAWNDTTHNILNGSLEGKSYVLRETKVEYRDRIVERTDTCYVEKPIPIEVEKVVKKNPKLLWWSLGINILVVLLVALRIYLKFQIGK